MAELPELDRRILDLLSLYQTTAGAWPRLRTLAERLGVTRRHVRRRLAALESAGHVARQQTWERGDDPGWAIRGQQSRQPGRQTSNLYVLGPLGHGETRKPSSTPRTSLESCPTSKPSTDHKPVGGTTPASGEHVLGVDADVWPAYADYRYYRGPGRRAPTPPSRGDPGRMELTVPKSDRLDRDPTTSQILGTIRAGLGDAEVIETRRHPVYRNSYGRTIDLETCTPAALHGAYVDLRYGNGKRQAAIGGRAMSDPTLFVKLADLGVSAVISGEPWSSWAPLRCWPALAVVMLHDRNHNLVRNR
jgi:hypothetical protein